MNATETYWLTWFVFALTYLGLALGKLPGMRLDRAGIALVGATLVLVTGLLTLQQAVSRRSIDYETLVLLFGMMVVVAFLRLSGVFRRLAHLALDRVQTPHGLLVVVIVLSGVLSAFLVNDVVCLALTPLVLHLARRLRFDPLPHLIALATASNIGSTGTITGNPQNMIIGTQSQISYLRFASRLMPVAVLGLAIDYAVVAWVFRERLRHRPGQGRKETEGVPEAGSRARERRPYVCLRYKSIAVTLAVVSLFFTGLPLGLVALGGAAVLLAVGRVKPEKVYHQIDWDLLVMFSGLFIVVRAFQVHVVRFWGVEHWTLLREHPIGLLSLVSAGLSNLVSNVPAVLLFEPVVRPMPDAVRETAWLALAMSSTLAGNLTVLGSVANLIVVENARRDDVTISFWDYGRVGIPVTLLTVTLGVGWLWLVPY